MVLYVDETENTEYFIVTGLLVNSQRDINSAYGRFKKRARSINISPKKRSQLFTEFKSNLMDRNYQKLKISMLLELNSIEHYVIYSCYIKKDIAFRQALKEDVYINLLTRIVESLSDSVDIIFDAFNKADFERKIVSAISPLINVVSIESCDSQKNPGLQFVDNLCSVCRLHLDNNDSHEFYEIIKENVKKV